MKNTIKTVIAIALVVIAGWLLVWPTYGWMFHYYVMRPINAFNPLPGTNAIIGLNLERAADATWVATVNYYYTGLPENAVLDLHATAEKPGRGLEKFKINYLGVQSLERGQHRVVITLPKPYIVENGVSTFSDDQLNTTGITASFAWHESPEKLGPSRSTAAWIQWPSREAAQLTGDIAKKPREAVLEQVNALIEAGDTRSLLKAKKMVYQLERLPNSKPAVDQMVRIEAAAIWSEKGVEQLKDKEIIGNEVRTLEYAKAYQELDEMAANLLKGKVRTSNGWSALLVFHNVDFRSEPQVELLEKFNLDDLNESMLNSPYRMIRLAQKLNDAAWKVRGTGYASSVSPDSWKRVRALWAKSADVLQRCASTCDVDPSSVSLKLSLMKTMSADKDQIIQVFVDGFQRYPEYFDIQWQMVDALSAKWGGSNEAVASFVNEVTSKYPRRQGDENYARLWSSLVADYTVFPDPLIGNYKIDCSRWIRGYDEILSKYPTSHNYNMGALTAVKCSDKHAAMKYFKKIGEDVDFSVWTLPVFTKAAVWAR